MAQQGYFASIFALDRHSGRWHKWHFLSYIRPHSQRGEGGGETPDQGLPGEGETPEAPDQGLPGRPPWEKPDREWAWPPGPTDPDWGIDAPATPEHPIYIDDVTGESPDNSLPPARPGRPGRHPDQGLPDEGSPPAPDQGLPGGGRPGRPPRPGRPGRHPDQSLPDEGEQPPIDPPPGTIWPPLPDDAPPGKHAFLFYIEGVGYRYGVLEVPEPGTVTATVTGGGQEPPNR